MYEFFSLFLYKLPGHKVLDVWESEKITSRLFNWCMPACMNFFLYSITALYIYMLSTSTVPFHVFFFFVSMQAACY